MAKYRKKPVVIEAVQWQGDNRQEVLDFDKGIEWVAGPGDFHTGDIYVPTLEGRMHASVGDYIIRGVAGEVYPCKADIFAATYDAVEE